MNLQCFHINVVAGLFRSLLKSSKRHWQHDEIQGAHVHETSLCVTYCAPRFGSNICRCCRRSKYVMFSLTFCAPVLQYTLCVAYGAPRRSLPSRLWAGLWPPEPPSRARNSGQPRRAWILAAQGRHGMPRTTFPDLTASIFTPSERYPP